MNIVLKLVLFWNKKNTFLGHHSKFNIWWELENQTHTI